MLYGETELADFQHMITYPDSYLVPMHMDVLLYNLCPERRVDDLNITCAALKFMHPDHAMKHFLDAENYTCAEIVRTFKKWKVEELPRLVHGASQYWNALKYNCVAYPECVKEFAVLARLPNAKTIALQLLEREASVPIKKLIIMLTLKFCDRHENVAFVAEPCNVERKDALYDTYKATVDSMYEFISMIRSNFRVSVCRRKKITGYTKTRLRNWWIRNSGLEVILTRKKYLRICTCYLFYTFAGLQNERSERVVLEIEREK